MLVPLAPLDTETGLPVMLRNSAVAVQRGVGPDPLHATMREMAARNLKIGVGHICIEGERKNPLFTILTLRCYGEIWTLRIYRPQWRRPIPQSTNEKEWFEFCARRLEEFSIPPNAEFRWDDTEWDPSKEPEIGVKCSVIYKWTEVEIAAVTQAPLF